VPPHASDDADAAGAPGRPLLYFSASLDADRRLCQAAAGEPLDFGYRPFADPDRSTRDALKEGALAKMKTHDHADVWELHRFTLNPPREVLKAPVTALRIAWEDERFRATFETVGGPLTISLRRHLLGQESYVGAQGRHFTRLAILDEQQLGVLALLGHVSRDDSEGDGVDFASETSRYGNRDLFIATRESRKTMPFLDKVYDFGMRTQMPLDDSRPCARAGTLRLARNELTIEPNFYPIELDPLASGGLEFRHVAQHDLHGNSQHSVGGLALPLDAAARHLLMVCFRHRHQPEVHAPAGDVPGHPLCTNVYGGVQAY
jgi:hypothetical protein